MASRNYLVMTEDMSLTDRKDYRMTALAAGLERCGTKGIGDIKADIPALAGISDAAKASRVSTIKSYIATGQWPRSIDQRELAPLTDFVAAAGQDSWLSVALAVGGVVSALNALAAYQLIAGKLMVCYGVSVEDPTVPMPVSRILFRRGGAAGNIQAQFDMEPMGVRQEVDAFFSEPTVQDPLDVFAIQVLGRAVVAGGARIHVHNFLFESAGLIVA